MWAFFKRDFIAYFNSPIGWIIIAASSLFGGFFVSSGIISGSVNIALEIAFLRGVLFLIIPLITMRLFSEEKKNGTDVIIYTSPVKLSQIVWAKFFSSFAFFLVINSIIFIHMLVVIIFGGRVDATAFGAFVGYILLGAIFLSVGILTSAMTENQIVSAVLSLTVIFFSQYIGFVAAQFRSFIISFMTTINIFNLDYQSIQTISQAGQRAILWIDPFSRMSYFFVGFFHFGSFVYSVGMVIFFLYITYQVIDRKRWSLK